MKSRSPLTVELTLLLFLALMAVVVDGGVGLGWEHWLGNRSPAKQTSTSIVEKPSQYLD